MDRSSGDLPDMISALGRIMRFPLDVLIVGVGFFFRPFLSLQEAINQQPRTTSGPPAPALPPPPGVAWQSGGNPGWAPSAAMTMTTLPSSTTPEAFSMDDQDLGGDDLKYVSYAIVFTKRDYEATLEENKQELVNYSTDGGSFGGLKIAKFFQKLSKQGVKRPLLWVESHYPPGTTDDTHWIIPEEDEKYLTFIYHVERRLPRQEADYDKRQVEILQKLSSKIR